MALPPGVCPTCSLPIPFFPDHWLRNLIFTAFFFFLLLWWFQSFQGLRFPICFCCFSVMLQLLLPVFTFSFPRWVFITHCTAWRTGACGLLPYLPTCTFSVAPCQRRGTEGWGWRVGLPATVQRDSSSVVHFIITFLNHFVCFCFSPHLAVASSLTDYLWLLFYYLPTVFFAFSPFFFSWIVASLQLILLYFSLPLDCLYIFFSAVKKLIINEK